MNIATTIKDEVIEAKISKPCCKRAFLSGVIRGAGSLSVENKGLGLVIQHSSLTLIEKCAVMIRSLTKAFPTLIQKDKERNLGSRLVYELRLPGEFSKQLLMETGITARPLVLAEGIPASVTETECCRKSYLKGLYAAAGSLTITEEISEPETRGKGYLLEIFISDAVIAEDAKKILESVGIAAKIRKKKTFFLLYIKDSEMICDFVAYIGANESYFQLQDIILSRQLRNSVNRRVNCEMANMDRSVAAASKQTEAIKRIDEAMGIQNLEEPLRETARVRLENPSASVSEILTLLSDAPTKSGFNHRMRKLIEIANELNGGKQP